MQFVVERAAVKTAALEPASTASRFDRLALAVLLAMPALLPFGRLSELPMLVGGVWALVWWARGRLALDGQARTLVLAVFAAYWLPQLLSAPDALALRRAWGEVLIDLRYLPWLLFMAQVLSAPAQRTRAATGLGLVIALWVADALVQAVSGWSLSGPALADRISGLFGADNLKLGPTLASLAPFALLWAQRRWGVRGLWLLAIPVTAAVLLAGARAGWLSHALVLAILLWRSAGGGRRGWLTLVVAAVLGLGIVAGSAALSPRFAERLARSAAAFDGGWAGLDHALSGRLPIWSTSVAIAAAHPLNGIGVRGFRDAYAGYADPDDRWLGVPGGVLHPHQWLLEVQAETGLLGLLCWLAGIAAVWRAWRRAEAARRAEALAPVLGLVAALWPLNTHFAVYASYWGSVLLLLAGWCVAVLGAPRAPR